LRDIADLNRGLRKPMAKPRHSPPNDPHSARALLLVEFRLIPMRCREALVLTLVTMPSSSRRRLFDERGKFRERQSPLYSSWAMPRYFRQSVQSIFLVYQIHER
jgi:hypothetical protein